MVIAVLNINKILNLFIILIVSRTFRKFARFVFPIFAMDHHQSRAGADETGKVGKAVKTRRPRPSKPQWVCYDPADREKSEIGKKYVGIDDRVREQRETHARIDLPGGLKKNISSGNDDRSTMVPVEIDGRLLVAADRIPPSETIVPGPITASRPAPVVDDNAERRAIERETPSLDELKRVARTVVRPGDEVFKRGIIDDLAMYFVYADLLSGDELTSVAGRPVGHLLVKLVKMFDKSRRNMAKLTCCLVCVYRNIARRTPVAADDPIGRLSLANFVRVVRMYLRELLDDAVWSPLFADSAVAFDWFRFMATLFIPNGNFVAADEGGRVIDNVVKYLEMVEYRQYSCAFDDKKTVVKIPLPKVEGCTLKMRGKKLHRPEVPKKRKTTPRGNENRTVKIL